VTALNQYDNGRVLPAALKDAGYLVPRPYMQITVELPDDITWRPDPGREALEALAVEGYRSGALSNHRAGQLLRMSRFEFDDFLTERKIYEHAYSIDDLEQDLEDLETLRAQGLFGG
jgi:predicted HTH domain antitoxin